MGAQEKKGRSTAVPILTGLFSSEAKTWGSQAGQLDPTLSQVEPSTGEPSRGQAYKDSLHKS